jgi:hypothetical protein
MSYFPPGFFSPWYWAGDYFAAGPVGGGGGGEMAVVTGKSTLSVGFAQLVTAGVVSPQSIPATIAPGTVYYTASGTGARQVDRIHAVQYTLAAAPLDLDLTALPNLSGLVEGFARVREIMWQVLSGGPLTTGGGASNPWAPAGSGAVTPVGVIRHLSDPLSTGAGNGLVVTSTSRTIRLDPGAATVVVNLLIAGCSAA